MITVLRTCIWAGLAAMSLPTWGRCPIWPPSYEEGADEATVQAVALAREQWHASACGRTASRRLALYNGLYEACVSGVAVPAELDVEAQASAQAEQARAAYREALRVCGERSRESAETAALSE